MRHLLIITLLLLIFCKPGVSQHNLGGLKKIEIPFQLENDFIILDVVFNKVLKLKFIFDTGAEYTILTKREFSDLLGVNYEREFQIMGADMKTVFTAYLARNLDFRIGDIQNPKQDFLVMGDDYFKFESIIGLPIHGIIGANFFNRYIIKIDYRRQIITFYDPQYYTPPSSYEEIPISVYKNKPYVNLDSKLYAEDSIAQIKLLLDTGASLALLLYTDTHSALRLPDKMIRANIGSGLGGTLDGALGRFNYLGIGSYSVQNLVASYQEIYESMDTTELNGRNGIIGNLILKKFDIIIDYHRERIFIKPNKNYKKGFRFDKSGLTFLASGKNLSTYTVSHVVPGSPADEVGILKGDEIRSVNFFTVSFIGFSQLIKKLQGRSGKKIRFVIRRNGKKAKKDHYIEGSNIKKGDFKSSSFS